MSHTNDLAPDDDPIVTFSLHESTLRLLQGLLQALADLTEPGSEQLSPEVRSYLMQTLDAAADLDLLFGILADNLAQILKHGKYRECAWLREAPLAQMSSGHVA